MNNECGGSLLNRIDLQKYDSLVQRYDFVDLINTVKIGEIAHALITKVWIVTFDQSVGEEKPALCRDCSSSCERSVKVLSP